MQIRTLNASFGVADQLEESDLASVAAAGYKTVVCNRPDAEGGTPMAKIEAACERHGLAFAALPVEFSTLGLADAERFGAILQESQAPLLAYCRSGRRSAALWALAMSPLAPAQQLLDRTAGAGIALEELRKLMQQRAALSAPASDRGEAAAHFAQRWIEGR